jgi:hypothetical protein
MQSFWIYRYSENLAVSERFYDMETRGAELEILKGKAGLMLYGSSILIPRLLGDGDEKEAFLFRLSAGLGIIVMLM